jgi:hypothetical protein
MYVSLSTIAFSLTCYLTDELRSPVSMNSNDLEVESEPAALRVNPELAEKNARELQESYETALRGECEEEDGPGNSEVEEEEEVVNDDDDGDSAGLATDDMMDVDGPGLSTNIYQS